MKSILTLMLMCSFVAVFAQTSKGSFLVSGNISYSHTLTKYGASSSVQSYKSDAVNLRPHVGYFPLNRLCVGLTLPVSFNSSRYAGTNIITATTHARSINLGPFLRYYYPLAERIFVLAEANYTWGFLRNEFNDGQISKNKSRQYQLGMGLTYFLNPNIGVELMGNFSKDTSPDRVGTNRLFAVSAGFQIYFHKK